MPDKRNARRYSVQFTPVGWHVIDTVEAGDPIKEFGLGDYEYAAAKKHAAFLNDIRQGQCLTCGEDWQEVDTIVICPECHSTDVVEVAYRAE